MSQNNLEGQRALVTGATSGIGRAVALHGEPGERPRCHDGYYAASVLDPDGNNIEVVNHHRQRRSS
jgi:predicted lactoylglutathione lyase